MSPDDYLRQRLEHHLPDEQGKEELIALLLPLLSMGARQSAATWQGLREEVAQAVVLALKDDADRQLKMSQEVATERANQLIAMGDARGDLAIQAIGTMGKADAIKLDKSRWQEAWVMLDHAAHLFQISKLSLQEQQIGWARTRIGRVFMAPELEKCDVAYAEAETARQILEQFGLKRKLISLHLNWARTYDINMAPSQSLPHYARALLLASELGEEGVSVLPTIYHNMAIALDNAGETVKAIELLNQSYQIISDEKSPFMQSRLANIDLTIGILYRSLGAYGRALRTAYRAEQILMRDLPRQWLAAVLLLMRCNVDLQRYTDARSYGEILLQHGSSHKPDVAMIHRLLAQIEIGLGNYADAEHHLQVAGTLLSESNSLQLLAAVRMGAGWLALHQKQYWQVLTICDEIETLRQGQPTGASDIEVMLLRGEANFGLGAMEQTLYYALRARRISRFHRRLPSLYRAHMLLGNYAETIKATQRAHRHYQAAYAATLRIQHLAGHSLHADVSATYHAAFHSLMRLTLSQGRVEDAFTILEGQKSRLFFSYLRQRERLRWERTPETTTVLDEFTRLRAEYHHCIRRREHDEDIPVTDRDKQIEMRIRQLTEYLYLHANRPAWDGAGLPTLATLQSKLPDTTALVAFYEDGIQLWCFVVEPHTIDVYPLSINHQILTDQINQLYENHNTTLQTILPNQVAAQLQAKKARQGYATLGRQLLAPLLERLSQLSRLYVVPYGILHRLPFNLLRIQGKYLIERCEVVTLPSAALLCRKQSAVVSKDSRWVGYSNNGRLPFATREVCMLQAKWGGELFVEEEATPNTMNQGAGRVLHLSTHGVHRVDHHFDLSYLVFEGAHLYEDDLLQMDLNYELVTLSACETGATKVAAGEELIGLGRAVLYARGRRVGRLFVAGP